MLVTTNLPATIEFYVNLLGFTCRSFSEESGWASLHKDAAHIMLSRPNEHEPFDGPQFTGSFYINTDNVDGWWEQLKDKARVCYPVENFDYGMREFAVYDNNGYLLQFGQPLQGNTET
jgi:uncharacterized glyoxalase superfamily protein PhnB